MTNIQIVIKSIITDTVIWVCSKKYAHCLLFDFALHWFYLIPKDYFADSKEVICNRTIVPVPISANITKIGKYIH